ncbi:MAG: hypothetical protein WKF73_15715 [Nocardioidaceae bacterium]
MGLPQRKVDTTYVVDGGYLENTGLLTLLQVYDALGSRITSCNTRATMPEAGSRDESASNTGTSMPANQQRTDPTATDEALDTCPMIGDQPALIEPWIVVLENHYRSVAAPAPARRPRELLLPPRTLDARKTTLGTVPLEQQAALAISGEIGAVQACDRFVRLAPETKPGVECTPRLGPRTKHP